MSETKLPTINRADFEEAMRELKRSIDSSERLLKKAFKG